MWRRRGEDWAASLLLLAAAMGLATAALALLSAVLRGTGVVDDIQGAMSLKTLVFGALLVLLVAVVHGLLWPWVSRRRDARQAERVNGWTERWVIALVEREIALPTPLPVEAQSALLGLRDLLHGEDAEALQEVAHRYDLGNVFGGYVRRSDTGLCMDALEGLARARLPSSLPILFETLVRDERRIARRMAGRAAARTIAQMPEGKAREEAGDELAAALASARLSPGVLEEVLGLLGPAGACTIVPVLGRYRSDHPLLVAALLTAARMRIAGAVPVAASMLLDRDPSVRRAAFLVVAGCGWLPAGCEGAVLAGLVDPVDKVRCAAARAAALLEPEEANAVLWPLLGERSWSVRLSAANALATSGSRGRAALKAAAERHEDRFGRDMAVHMLRITNKEAA